MFISIVFAEIIAYIIMCKDNFHLENVSIILVQLIPLLIICLLEDITQ